MMSQNNDLKKSIYQVKEGHKRLKSDQPQQQTHVKDPEQECSRSKMMVKSCAIENVFKFWGAFRIYQLIGTSTINPAQF
jgi:hypothetical protein